MAQVDPATLGVYRPIHLLLGVVCIGLGVLAFLRYIFALKRDPWHASGAPDDDGSEIELDAAEKGDSSMPRRRSLAEKIPYDLEKRALMHKRWLMVSHDSQFKKPGDYRTYTLADIPFIVIRGKDGRLRAFHNVCRHRAYTVVRKQAGNSSRLHCKYQKTSQLQVTTGMTDPVSYSGWQYDSTGSLLKAPQFMDKPGFDATANGLFEIHLRIDSGRFVFVNFATELSDAFPWSDISPSYLKSLDFESAVEWETEVEVNWRIASLLPWFLDPSRLATTSWQQKTFAYVHGVRRPRLQYVDDTSFICNLGHGCFLLISSLPLDGHKTVFKHTFIPGHGRRPASSLDTLQGLVDVEVRASIDVLRRQRTTTTNLDFRQSAVRERLDKFARHIDHHRRMEYAAGRKITPAARITGRALIDTEAEAICSALDGLRVGNNTRCMERRGELEW